MRYVTTRDIIIPAGAEVTVEENRTSRYMTPHASVLMAITPDITAEWMMDMEEALAEGLVIEEAGPSDAEEAAAKKDAKDSPVD